MNTIHSSRQVSGKISQHKLGKRYQNLLNLIYLQAEPVDGGGYRIPSKVFESIQTELDFHVPEEKCKIQTIESQIKKRYRQRASYRFWKDFLDVSNINDYAKAKEFLMRIFDKLDKTRHYGSMTHSQYALETMHLALDDFYGTNNLILNQYKFTNPNLANKKKKSKAKKTRKTKKTLNIPKVNNADLVPF